MGRGQNWQALGPTHLSTLSTLCVKPMHFFGSNNFDSLPQNHRINGCLDALAVIGMHIQASDFESSSS